MTPLSRRVTIGDNRRLHSEPNRVADFERITGKQEGTKLLLVCGQFTRSAAWPPEIHSILEKNLTAGKAKPMQCSLLVAKHGKAAPRRVLRSFVLNDVQISARSQRIRARPAIL